MSYLPHGAVSAVKTLSGIIERVYLFVQEVAPVVGISRPDGTVGGYFRGETRVDIQVFGLPNQRTLTNVRYGGVTTLTSGTGVVFTGAPGDFYSAFYPLYRAGYTLNYEAGKQQVMNQIKGKPVIVTNIGGVWVIQT